MRAIEELKQAMEVCELGALTLPDQVDALMDAARAILQEISTLTPPNEWVNRNVHLPEWQVDVLVLYDSGKIDINWVDSVGEFMYENIYGRVTHWMPLPAPPAGGGVDK